MKSKQFEATTVLITLILALYITISVVVVKSAGLRAWMFTSDIFTYDQLLSEMLSGHFGLDFTFGNSFGDHAYLILYLLLPVKYILEGEMVFFLAALSPIAYLVTVLTALACLYRRTEVQNLFLGMLVMMFPPFLFNGLYEFPYGFHPDYFGAAMLTCFVLVFDRLLHSSNRASRILHCLAWLFLILAILSKEEICILAMVVIGVLIVKSPRVLAIRFLIFCAIVLYLEFAVISHSETQFNRSNAGILLTFFGFVRDSNLQSAWGAFRTPLYLVAPYAGLFIFCIYRSTGQVSVAALALLIGGVLKAVGGLLILDQDPSSWHNFPALILLSSACALQLCCGSNTTEKSGHTKTLSIASGIVIIFLVLWNGRLALIHFNYIRGTTAARDVEPYNLAMTDILSRVNKKGGNVSDSNGHFWS